MINFCRSMVRGIRVIRPLRFQFSKYQDDFGEVYQSKYYQPKFKVSDFLNKLGIEKRISGSTYRIKECMFCHKPHNDDPSNLYTLNVEKDTGLFYCHRCQTKGSWSQFQAKYLKLNNQISSLQGNPFESPNQQQNNETMKDFEYFIYKENLKKPEFAVVKDYILSRGFTQETIQKYELGAGVEEFINEDGIYQKIKVVYFPMFQLKTKKKEGDDKSKATTEVKLVRVKSRGASRQTKGYSRQSPPGPRSGFFGMNTINENDKFVVITQGEFDAMAVNQETGYPAISLPQGANSLPDHLLPMLDRFEKIYLWMDNDEAGRLGQQKISHKLGSKRTFIIKHDYEYKDANDFLLKAPQSMKKLIDESKNKAEENILVFNDLQDLVIKRITKSEIYTGTKIQFLPFFNKNIKGIRAKEVSVVSGPTGCGKTTFLSQLSLDLAKKQMPILWGSFQILNEVLLTNMLIQYAGLNLMKNKGSVQHYCSKFRQLPLYFLNFQDTYNVEQVLATIEYSIEQLGVGMVVIDTLQFFLSNQAEGYQKFDLQDKVMSRFRRMATNYSVHIIVVIHPRKTDDGEDIQISSIYGSSKATQEADNIWVLQNRPSFRVFDVKKNRFDGQVGKVGIAYDRQTKCFFQLTRSELRKLLDNQATVEEIVIERNSNNHIDDPSEGFNMETGGSLDSPQDQSSLTRKSSSYNNRNK